MFAEAKVFRHAGPTLGDPLAVAQLLSIVTGVSRRQNGAPAPASPRRTARPTVEVLPDGWEGDTLLVERTPFQIRALCVEGIIGAATPWKQARPSTGDQSP